MLTFLIGNCHQRKYKNRKIIKCNYNYEFYSRFSRAAVDWRQSLRQNRWRTTLVIATVILIYLLIGLLVDRYIYVGRYPEVAVSQLFFSLLTFQFFPKATIITELIAAVSLYVTFAFSYKLMMFGTEYREITPDGLTQTYLLVF